MKSLSTWRVDRFKEYFGEGAGAWHCEYELSLQKPLRSCPAVNLIDSQKWKKALEVFESTA